MDNGNKVDGKKLPYLEAKYLRGKTNPKYLNKGIEVFAGDYLILVDGENSGEVFINKENGYLGSTFKILNISQNMNFEYFVYILKYFQSYLKNSKKGAAIPHLNKKLFKNLIVTIPPIKEQARIVIKLKEMETYIEKYNTTQGQLEILNNSYKEELKKSILQYAIQGKLVKQDLNDESAKVLINKILDEKRELIKTKQIKKENLSVIYKDDTDNQFYEKFDNGKIVNITDEIPFDIPDNWVWTRLGNILTKLTDGTHKTPKYVENGVHFVSVKDMSSGTLKLDNTKYITKEEHKTLFERCNPQKGDIILSKVGTTGIPVIVETDIEFSLFVSLALLKSNNEYIDREYLKNLILSPLVQKQCKENTKGVGNKNWVMKDIAKTLIVIPPHNEQVKIIEKLNTLFSII